jgi:hypothetical protein
VCFRITRWPKLADKRPTAGVALDSTRNRVKNREVVRGYEIHRS